MKAVWFFCLLLFGCWIQSTSGIQCRDECGHLVDWYVVYKFPYIKQARKEVFGGYRYAFLTSDDNNGWRYSNYQTTDKENSIFAKTLNPVYEQKPNSVFYNDQPPDDEQVSSSYAHAKGVIAFDERQGFWLIHSVPHFPPSSGPYDYVRSGGRYGQVAMCISMPVSEIAKVIQKNLLVSRPYVYSLTNHGQDRIGDLLRRLDKRDWEDQDKYSDTELKSLANETFRSFYKSPNDRVDLYAGIVAPAMDTSLKVETWRHDPGHPLDSECKIKNEFVENVKEIQIEFVNSKDTGYFSYYDDHSKWAITDSHLEMVCLGDINRVQSQFKRGGGTTCLKKNSVWSAFNSFIEKVEQCRK